MEQNQNQQQQFKCSGDCLKCTPIQRQYCASQFTYNTMRMVEHIQGTLDAMSGTIAELQEKIAAIQGNEATLFDPTTAAEPSDEVITETEIVNAIAQSGDGA